MKGRTGGRRKGTSNKVTAEARAVCAAIVDDPTYRKTLVARAKAGELSPAIEAMLWHYAYGKPEEQRRPRDTPRAAGSSRPDHPGPPAAHRPAHFVPRSARPVA